MTNSAIAQLKINTIKAYTTAYLEALHPGVLEEARAAARKRWNEEHPDDPYTGKPGRRPVRWE